jgi:hypothetical protein
LLVTVKDWCLLPVWYGLMDFGRTMYAPMGGLKDPEEQRRPPRSVALGRNGLPPGHPERLRPDLPLSDLERLLARELFPYHSPHHPEDRGFFGG